MSQGAGTATTGAINSTAGKVATHAAARHGVNAMQAQQQNQRAARQQRLAGERDHAGLWASQNPNQATAAATVGAVRYFSQPSMGGAAASAAQSNLQAGQFGPR